METLDRDKSIDDTRTRRRRRRIVICRYRSSRLEMINAIAVGDIDDRPVGDPARKILSRTRRNPTFAAILPCDLADDPLAAPDKIESEDTRYRARQSDLNIEFIGTG